MHLKTGVDIVELERIRGVIKRHGERFFRSFFTTREQERISGKIDRAAGCFAAKEAVAKALGTGIRGFHLREIEIVHDEWGAPSVLLHGKAAALLAGREISLSISHSRLSAVAFAVIAGD